MFEGIKIAPHKYFEVLEINRNSNLKWTEYTCYLQMEGRITIPLVIKLLLFAL